MKRLQHFLSTLTQFASTKTARRLVLGFFVAQALLLACITHIGVPPDENNHIEFVEYYANHSLSPIFQEQTPTWRLGDKTREVDYLYHYGASFVARVLPDRTPDVYALRVLTVLAAFATFVLLARLLKRLGVSSAAITVTIAILTNLPMVLMVSAAVNNDVFVWLGYVVTLLLLLRIWQRPTALDVTWLLALSAAGGLVKRTLLPVSAIIVVIAILFVIRRWASFKKTFQWTDWRLIVAVVALLLASGLFVERVGGNLYRYGTPNPECEQVQGAEACDVFWANSRKKWLDAGSPAEKNTWLGAGTTRDDAPLNPVVFASKWLVDSTNNILDIQTQGWRHVAVPPLWLAPSLLTLLLGAIAYGFIRDIRLWRNGDRPALQRLVIIATAFVVMAAHLSVNYASYLQYHVFGLALNGRYILPAILVLVGLSCYYIAQLLPRPVKQVLALLTILCVVVFSGLFMMLRNSQLVTG